MRFGPVPSGWKMVKLTFTINLVAVIFVSFGDRPTVASEQNIVNEVNGIMRSKFTRSSSCATPRINLLCRLKSFPCIYPTNKPLVEL